MGLRMPTPIKRKGSSRFTFKERVPADLVDRVRGRVVLIPVDGEARTVKLGEFAQVSLRTSDHRVAKERHREVSAAVQELWHRFRQEAEAGPVKLTARQIEALAGTYYRDTLGRHEEEPGEPDDWDAASDVTAAAFESGDLREKLHGEDADRLLLGQALTVDAESRARLIVAMNRAYSQASERLKRMAWGDYSTDSKARRFPDANFGQASMGTPRAGRSPTVSGVFEEWKLKAAERNLAPATIRRFSAPVTQFIAFLGHDEVLRVTSQDVRRWRDHLTANGVSLTTFAKVNRAALSVVFEKAIDLGHLTENPALGVKVEKVKAIVLRDDRGFTREEAKTILRAALDAPERRGKTGPIMRRAQRWVPWLCAYTGARVGEVAQLRKEDVQEEEGIAFLRITPEAGSVKNRMARSVPLHPHLIEQGFLKFVKASPEGPLFYSTAESKGKRHPKTYTTDGLAEWVRGLGVDDKSIGPNHAWRHLFKTLADAADIPPKFSDAICGHAPRSEGDRYGRRDVPTLKREVDKIPAFRV